MDSEAPLPANWSLRFTRDGNGSNVQHRAALYFHDRLACQFSVTGNGLGQAVIERRLASLALDWISDDARRGRPPQEPTPPDIGPTAHTGPTEPP